MGNVNGDSTDIAVAAVKGEYTGTGSTYVHDGGKGVQGYSQNGYGVQGTSEVGRGVVASSDTNYGLRATSRTLSAARCSSSEGSGVEGEAGSAGDGVRGTSKSGNGIHGISESAPGVLGESKSGRGVVARSDTDYGLRAASRKSAGIRGSSDEGRGVEGWAVNSEGVVGISTSGNGVWGQTEGNGVGVLGTSKSGIGVYGKGGGLAGHFEGNVEVTGDLNVNGHSISQLLQRIEELERRLVSTQPSHGIYQAGKIEVTRFDGFLHTDGKRRIRCKFRGSGFNPIFGVTIRVVTQLMKVADLFVQTDAQGNFDNQDFMEFIDPGVTVFIAATDKRSSDFDLTGQLWSNTVSLSLH